MSLSTPALVVLVGFILVLVAVFIPIKQDPKVEQSYNAVTRLKIFAIMLIPMALTIYNINCMIEGSCMVWTWFLSIILFVLSIVIFSISVYNSRVIVQNRIGF